ncbi:MAG: hypothetical protein U0L85_01285 [Bacilli bacterium]|nr:hypothetical protein [Bacilli bacterium]
MGCGLLALGLWLLFGLKINISDSSLIPPFIAYIIIIWALIVLLKRYNNKNLVYSLVLSIICLIIELLPVMKVSIIIGCIISFLQLYFLLRGIKYILGKYVEIELYVEKSKRYIYNFGIINILIILMNIFDITHLVIANTLVVILAIQTFGICRQLYKINDYLYRLDEPIKVENPIPRKKKYKIIAIIIIFISIMMVMLNESVLPEMIYDYSNKTVHFLMSGENDNIKVENFEVYYFGDYRGYFVQKKGPDIYVKEEIGKEVERIVFNISIDDSDMIYSINTDSFYTTLSQYDGYQLLKFEESDFTDMNIIEFIDRMNNHKAIVFTLKYYDDEENVITEEKIHLNSVVTKEYGYEDSAVEIKNVFIYENRILSSPFIRIKNKYLSQFDNTISIKAKFYNKNYINTYDIKYSTLDIYDTELDSDIIREGELIDVKKISDDFKVIILIYKDNQIVDTLEYRLEELQ